MSAYAYMIGVNTINHRRRLMITTSSQYIASRTISAFMTSEYAAVVNAALVRIATH